MCNMERLAFYGKIVHLMKNLRKQVREILDNLSSFLDDHNSMAEIAEIKGNRVVLHVTGHCADCDTNCIEDSIREKLPLVEVIIQ